MEPAMTVKGFFNTRWPAAALFDLDGTLADSALDLVAAVNQTLERLDRPPAGIDQVRQWIGHGAAVLIRRALAGTAGWQPASAADDALFEEAMTLFFKYYETANGQHAKVYPGVMECLNRLQQMDCPMAIVTNKPEQFVAPLLEQLKLDGYFQLIIGGDTLASKKPDPEPLLYAMRALNGRPATTVMVGDSAADVQAAKAAGISCVAVTYGYNFGNPVRALGANVVVDSLSELL
jgi:phosphoglycolate phosphatase